MHRERLVILVGALGVAGLAVVGLTVESIVTTHAGRPVICCPAGPGPTATLAP